MVAPMLRRSKRRANAPKPLHFSCQSVVRYASVAGLEFSMTLLRHVLPRNIRPQLGLIMQASAAHDTLRVF